MKIKMILKLMVGVVGVIIGILLCRESIIEVDYTEAMAWGAITCSMLLDSLYIIAIEYKQKDNKEKTGKLEIREWKFQKSSVLDVFEKETE